ncbi:MAG: hypothetical protein ACOCRK_06690 [bacterium]
MENELELIDLTYQDIEEQLSNYTYEIMPIYDNRVESASFPYFVESFYNLIFYEGYLPSCEDFIDYYLEVNADKNSVDILDEVQKIGLKARLSRSYPSLVRDVHFAKLLEDRLDLDVLYNIELDTTAGIDVLLEDKYGFHLFYDSKRSHNFRKKKISRHNELDTIIEFDLPFNEDNGKEIGNVYLYNDWYVIKALELIVKEEDNE